MLKELFKNLIFRVLGDYIEEFSLDDMNINSWTGTFAKEYISLKPSAVEKIFYSYAGLNVRLTKAVVGKLFFQVPWTKIWKEPCHVVVENVHILGSLASTYNHEGINELLIEDKLSRLKEIEENERKMLPTTEDNPTKAKLKKFLRIIIENLRLEIKNFHLRIEDPAVTVSSMKYAFGFVIDSFIWEPANSKFERHFVDPETRKKEKVSYSMLTFNGIGLYTDLAVKELWSERGDIVKMNAMEYSKFSCEYYQSKDQKSFIIKPTKIVLQKTSKLQDIAESETPTRHWNIIFDELHFTMDDQQFKIVYYLMAFYNWHNQRDLHFIYRPDYHIRPNNQENSKLWWDYAIKSVLLKVRQKRDERQIQTIAKRRVARERYIELYQVKLVHDIEELEVSGKNKLFSPDILIHASNGTEDAYITFEEMLAVLVNYERNFSLEECLHYRQVAKNKLKDFEYMNQFIIDKIKEPEKNKNENPGFFQKMLSRIGFQSKEGGYQVDRNVIENIEDFVKNNNIFERIERDAYSPLKFHTRISLHINSAKIDLKQKEFSFFNSTIDDFLFEYMKYESKKILTVRAMNVNILDELTSNHRFVNVLKFNGETQTPAVECAFISEKFSENPYDSRKRLHYNVSAAPFELVLNKDLLTRLNFMLKNPIVNSSIEQDFEIHPEMIEKKIKEKVLKHLGKNSKIEVFAKLPQYSVVLPQNPNAEDTSYFILDGKGLDVTTEGQSQEGNSFYTLSYEKIVLKQITRQKFTFNSSYDKVYNENETKLAEAAGLSLNIQKSITGDGRDIVIDFEVKGTLADVKLKTANLSSLLFRTQNNLKVSEINQPIMAGEAQLQKSNVLLTKESELSNGMKEIKKSKIETTKSRTSSFFEDGIPSSTKRQSILEAVEFGHPRKESFNVQQDSFRENEEAEEFFEAFEDLDEMLEAEKVIANNIVKLESAKEPSSTMKRVKSQATFQIFTLKYIQWSVDVGIQSLSLEVELEEDFNLANSALYFEQKDILIQAHLAPEEINVNAIYSTMQLEYRLKKNLEVEKCFELKFSSEGHNKNSIRFKQDSLGQSNYSLILSLVELNLRPSLNNELVQISKLLSSKKAQNGQTAQNETPDPEKESTPIELDVHIENFDIRLLEQNNNYVKVQTNSLKFSKSRNGSINSSLRGLKLLMKNPNQKFIHPIITGSKKQPHNEDMLSFSRITTKELGSAQEIKETEININYLKVIVEYRGLSLALPILLHYRSLLKNLPSNNNKEQEEDKIEESSTKSNPKMQVKIKKFAVLLKPRVDPFLLENESHTIPELYYTLKQIGSQEIERKHGIRNHFKFCFEFSMTVDNRTGSVEMNYQLAILAFHNNVINRLLNNIEGNLTVTTSEAQRQDIQLQIKPIHFDINSFDIELIKRLLLECHELNAKFGKSLFRGSDKKASGLSQKPEQSGSENHITTIKCITLHLASISLRIQIVSNEILEMVNNGSDKKQDIKVEEQLVTVFERINFVYVTGGKEAQITSCAVYNIISYLKTGATSNKIWLLQKILGNQKPGAQQAGMLKIKYVNHRSVEIQVESARYLIAKDVSPLITAIKELATKLKSAKPQSNAIKDGNGSPKKESSEPIEIIFSIRDLSFCLYDYISHGPNSLTDLSGKKETNENDSVVVLNFMISTNTMVKYVSNSLNVTSEFIDLSLSLTPKKVKHLSEQFRQEYIIFPTRFRFDFKLCSEEYLQEIKFVNLHFFEELCVDISSNHMRLVNKIMTSSDILTFKENMQKKGKKEKAATLLNVDHLEISIPKSYLTLLIGKDVEVISKKNVYPLLNATLLNLHIIGKKKQVPQFHHFSCSFNLQLYYLNERNLYFEPLIENFNLKFDYESENNAKTLKLEAFDDLLVNLTSASVDTMLKLSEEWSNLKVNALTGNSSNVMQNKAPICIIKNETGSALKCWINGDDITNVDKQQEKQIHHKTIIEFGAYNLSKPHSSDKVVKNIKSMNEGRSYYGKSNSYRNIFKFEENDKTLNIRIDSFNEIIKLNLDQEGVFPWTIGNSNHGCNILIDVSFSYEKGTKIIDIRSNVNLINRLIRPMSVRLIEKSTRDEEIRSHVINLGIGETLPVPVDHCNFNAIEIKPLGPSNYGPDFVFKWSKDKPISIKEEEVKLLFTCPGKDESSGEGIYVLMSKEKKSILPQVAQSQIKDSILPSMFEWVPAMHSLTFTHPVQIENLLPIPISLKFKMPVAALLSRFISKNMIYGDHMKNIKTLISSQINMYTSKEIVIPELGEGFVEDIHPFNGILLSLAMANFEGSDFHEVMDQAFQESLRNYMKLAGKLSSESSVFYPQGNEEFLNQFSKPYIFSKIFQFFSETQNEQLNVCLETVFYKGNLKLTFFSQYWFMNEACYPLQIRFTEGSFTYDPIQLSSSNSPYEGNKRLKDGQNGKESNIFWRPKEEGKDSDKKQKHSFDLHSDGFQSLQRYREVEENLINIHDLDNTLFSLKSSQLSKAYIENLLKSKSKYLKLVTTNLVDNAETTMDIAMEDFTDWSNSIQVSSFSTTQPVMEMLEKVSEREKPREKDKVPQDEKVTYARLFELCLNVVQLPGKLNRTKLVLIAPKYVIVNSTKFNLLVSQMPDSKYVFGQIPAENAMSFHWSFKDKPKNLYIKIDKKNYLWSPAFIIQKPTSFSFRMRSLDEQEMQILSVNIVKHSSIYLILIKAVNEKPPYLIDNNTRYHIKVYQEGRHYYDIVKPNEKSPYALDAISVQPNINVFLVDTNNGSEASLGVIDLSQKERITITKKNFDNMFLDYLSDGPTTILKFHYGIRDSDQEDSQTGAIMIEVKANRIGVSVIDYIFNNGIHKELVFMQYEKILLMFQNTGKQIEIKAKLYDIQIDNKLVGTPLPVLLTTNTDKTKNKTLFTKVFKFVKSEIKDKMLRKEDAIKDNFFKFHLVLGLSQEKLINQLRLFKVKIRPIELNIDGNLLEIFRKIITYFSQKILPSFSNARPKLKEEDFSLDQIQGVLAEKKSINEEGVTIEKLVISDINLTLNFKNFHAFIKEVSHFYILRLLALVFNNFGSFVLAFDEFLLKNTKVAFDSLVNQLISYYTTCLNKQIYWLIANADIIGNPSLFINQLSTAFSEFIEEFGNQLSLNPLSLGYGILKSTQSLFQSVVTAFVDSGDKIIQNIQNGIFLTFIEDTERLHTLEAPAPDSSFESSEQSRYYQSLIQPQKRESMDSILGSVSNLVHALILFPFSQPITPYIMSKRKKQIKKAAAHLVPKRPVRYIASAGILEAFDETKSRIQEFLYNIGERFPFELDELYDSENYVVHFHVKGIILLDKGTQEIEDFITYENAELEKTEDEQVRLIVKRDNKMLSLEDDKETIVLTKSENFNKNIQQIFGLFKRDEA